MARAPKKASDKKTGNLTHDNTTNALTDDQRQALFFQHKRKIAGLKEKLGTVNGDLRNAYKIAKAEGFPKKDFDFAFLLEKDEDDAAIERRRREAEIARWLGHAIGTQGDLFEGTKLDKRSIAESAFEDGKRAGMNNEVLKPSHGAGTEAYERYVAGWHEGSAVRASLAKEQEDGAAILRMNEESDGADEFDEAADDLTDTDTSEPLGDGESEAEPGETDDGAPWPDDVSAAAKAEEREPAEAL